ncbi:hypothetical protein EVC30_097 [Rhizobium phage RHph_Y1_11]|nr:hypothetical protein EVC30_097 [Rhizobium phage RHph_Y1_11]
MAKKDKLEDVEVYLHHWTEKAYLVSADGDNEQSVWIPKSRCEVSIEKVGQVTLTAPQSYLEELELC